MKPNVLSEGPFVREKGLRQREGPTSERRAYVREKGLRQREGPTSKRTAYIREKDLRQGEGPKLKTLDFALYIGSTSTFCISTLPTQHTKFNNIINAVPLLRMSTMRAGMDKVRARTYKRNLEAITVNVLSSSSLPSTLDSSI